MKRFWAFLAVPALAMVLASCGGGAPTPGGATDAASTPAAQSPAPATDAPAPGTSAPDPDPDAPVVGQWGGETEGSPVLWFAESGTYNGNDGCNTLAGQWSASGAVFKLENTAMTLMACPGKDTWLSGAATVRVEGETLHVDGKDGTQIGTLPRINVAG